MAESNNAQGARAQILRYAEPIYGVPPADDIAADQQRFSASDMFPMSREEESDPTVTGDRQPKEHRAGNISLTGSIDGVLAIGAFDDLLESAFMSEWSTNDLIIGSEIISFTFEDYQPDIAAYVQNVGCVANTWSLSVPLSGPATCSFGLLGSYKKIVDHASEEPDISDYPETKHFNNIGATVTFGDISDAECQVLSVNLALDNSMTADMCWGSGTANGISAGVSAVTGSIELYYRDTAQIQKWIDDTEIGLTLKLNVGSGASADHMYFYIPRAVYTGLDNPWVEGSRIITIPFKALFDDTQNSSIKITRSSKTGTTAGDALQPQVTGDTPLDVTVNESAAATFTVTGLPAGFDVQWYEYKESAPSQDDFEWRAIVGATSSTFTTSEILS